MSNDHFDLDELAGLEDQRAFLLRSLDDLDREREAGDIDDTDYETLQADYTRRAAAVLHAIEHRHDLIDATAPGRRGLRLVVAVVGVVIVAVVAGFVVANLSGGRNSATPPGGETLQPSSAVDSCIALMQKTFSSAAQGKTNPAMASDALAAIKCFTGRVESHPSDAVAYTYRGWTLTLLARELSGSIPAGDIAGFVQRARADFTEARKLAPRYPDALTYAAISAMWSGDLEKAQSLLSEIDGLQLPANSPILAQVNQMLRPALTAAVAAATSTTVVPPAPTVAPATSSPKSP